MLTGRGRRGLQRRHLEAEQVEMSQRAALRVLQ